MKDSISNNKQSKGQETLIELKDMDLHQTHRWSISQTRDFNHHNSNCNSNRSEKTKTQKWHQTCYSLICIPFLNAIQNFSFLFQGWIIYLILICIIIILLISFLYSELDSIFSSLSDKNFYNININTSIEHQRIIKTKLDIINNNDISLEKYRPLIFTELYALNLVNKSILKENDIPFSQSLLWDASVQSLYSRLDESFSLKDTLSKVVTKTNPKSYFIPFFFHIIPVLYQNSLINGVTWSTFSFLIYQSDCSKKNNNLYFKYPIESEEINIENYSNDYIPNNTNIYDYVYEPISKCFISDLILSDSNIINNLLIDKAKNVNWYFIYEEYMLNFLATNSATYPNKMLVVTKQKSYNDNEKIQYFINNILLDIPGEKEVMLLTFKINKLEINHAFTITDINKNSWNFNYLSLYNYINPDLKFPSVKINFTDEIYYDKYNIDDSIRLFDFIPNIINEFFTYTILPNCWPDLSNNCVDIINPQTFLWKFDEIDKIESSFTVSYYFRSDTAWFKLIAFLNNYLNDATNCYNIGIENYYNIIKEKIDCWNDYCNYNECIINGKASKYYISVEHLKHIPNCYCLPWYCWNEGNERMWNSTFHELVKSTFSIDDTYDYGFNKLKDKNFAFKCQISFFQKTANQEASFNVDIFMQNMDFDFYNVKAFMLMFSFNDRILEDVMKFLNDNVWSVKFTIYFIFGFILSISIGFFVIDIYIKWKKLILRMDEIRAVISNCLSSTKEITNIEMICENANSKNNKDKKNQTNKDQIEQVGDKDEKEVFIQKKDKDGRAVSKEEKVPQDELDCWRNIIIENLNLFKVEFNVNENINENMSTIKNSFTNIVNANSIKKYLFENIQAPQKEGEIKDILSNNTNMAKDDLASKGSKKLMNNTDVDISNVSTEISLTIWYELYSMSTSEIFDFFKVKTNYYYRENMANSWWHWETEIGKLKNCDNCKTNDLTNSEKIKNALNYYLDNIHSYWKDVYNYKKQKENN